jgi:hypothetical protein
MMTSLAPSAKWSMLAMRSPWGVNMAHGCCVLGALSPPYLARRVGPSSMPSDSSSVLLIAIQLSGSRMRLTVALCPSIYTVAIMWSRLEGGRGTHAKVATALAIAA